MGAIIYQASTITILLTLILSLSNIATTAQSYRLSNEEVLITVLISVVPLFNTVFAILLIAVMVKFMLSDQ